jgi:hypothetical protein
MGFVSSLALPTACEIVEVALGRTCPRKNGRYGNIVQCKISMRAELPNERFFTHWMSGCQKRLYGQLITPLVPGHQRVAHGFKKSLSLAPLYLWPLWVCPQLLGNVQLFWVWIFGYIPSPTAALPVTAFVIIVLLFIFFFFILCRSYNPLP